jgi:acetylornithine aminotransferase/acetylornithine/N-succinyldiaminopimelate aminotransferase
MRNSFHGRTTGALSVTGRDEYRKPFGPLLEPIEFVDANDCRALNAAVDDRTIAVITETIQGEAGIYPLKSEFLSTVRDLTRQAGALWIADETQCGLGRTGWRFAYQMPPIVSVPDVVATAKPLAAGLPLGATIFSEEAATIIQPGMHASTFGGGPLACRVALETLSIIDELLPHIRTVAAYMENRLSWLQSRHSAITEVRGAGLMTGIQLNQPGHRFVTACLDHGLAINCTRSSVLRLLPPYIVTPSQIDEAVAILDAVLKV